MDLRLFLQQLAADQQLKTITDKTSCDLEMAQLCRREFQSADGGLALQFTNLQESDYQCAANLFGNERRLLRLLGCQSLTAFESLIDGAIKVPQSRSVDVMPEKAETELKPLALVDLKLLPAVRSWPGEGSGYFTLGLTLTRDPETGSENLGLYRAQVVSATEIALNFASGSGADLHWQKARQLQQPLPVAIIFGGDPRLLWAAAAPLPATDDEFTFCRRVFGSTLQFTPCASQPLSVPAAAELVIEGVIAPDTTCSEGPFGNHTGQYVRRLDCPQLRVTAVMARPQPIIPVTIVGPPPSENIYLAKANEVLIRAQLRHEYPQLVDVRLPALTAFHGVCLLQLREGSKSGNRELIEQLWRRGPLRRSKFMLLVDEDITLNDFSRCWWRAINMLQADSLYQDGNRFALDATGVDPALLVQVVPQPSGLLNHSND